MKSLFNILATMTLAALLTCGCRDDCVPDCSQQNCGLDPECGESCGGCQPGSYCVEGSCVNYGSCSQADAVFIMTVDAACACSDLVSCVDILCCACYCWAQDRLDFDLDAYNATGICNCLPLDMGPCEGDRLIWAEACMADVEACQADTYDLIHGSQGFCTLTPL